jgi:hypothetical protein
VRCGQAIISFGSFGSPSLVQETAGAFMRNQRPGVRDTFTPPQHHDKIIAGRQRRIEEKRLKMLIQETHKDVPTKADGKDGSMSRYHVLVAAE